MSDAEAVEVDAGLDAVQTRCAKLEGAKRAKDKRVVEARTAEWSRPPKERTQAERILALAKSGENFWCASMDPRTKRLRDAKQCKVTTLIGRLKNPSLAVATFRSHDCDSPTGVEMRLMPSQAYVEVAFCLAQDAGAAEVAKFEFVANSN